jgi:oligo-1,6-glucosidase
MQSEVLSKYDIMTVGETGGVTVDEAVQYANAEGTELNMVFQFETVELDGGETFKWNDRKIILTELKEVLSRWQLKLFGKAWNSLYWCNHDQPRIVSRLGDEGVYREKSAKMLATCLHFMQGTPYIYQGEELGMTNTPFTDITDYRDLESIYAYKALVDDTKYFTKEDMLRYMALKSRDTSRTPMQWDDSPNAGFSNTKPDTICEPWIMVNPNYIYVNAEEQVQREDSVFKYYQKLIQLRKTMDIITYGNFELLLAEHSDLFVYIRSFQQKKLLVVCNFTNEDRPFTLPEGFTGKNILISNDETDRTYTTELSSQGYRAKPSVVLGPYSAVVYSK